jgi:hypothetical protein
MTTLVTAASSPEQLRDVRELMRAFIAWLLLATADGNRCERSTPD